MFNVNEEIDDIIDEINDDFCESAYEEIYEELCYRVECGELSLEDAEIINEAAYDRYVLEDKSDIANYYALRDAADKISGLHTDGNSRSLTMAVANRAGSTRSQASNGFGAKQNMDTKRKADRINARGISLQKKMSRKDYKDIADYMTGGSRPLSKKGKRMLKNAYKAADAFRDDLDRD